MVSVVAHVDVGGSVGQAQKALDVVQGFMTRPQLRDVEGWLAALSVLVPYRGSDEFREELRLAAYAARVAQYPADVAHHVLLRQTWRFWPSWHELERACEALTQPRRAIIAALRRASEQIGPEAQIADKSRERASPEAVAAIMARYRSHNGAGSEPAPDKGPAATE